MKKRWFILGILLIVILVIMAFVYYSTATPNYKKENIQLVPGIITNIDPVHVKYLLNEMGAYQLHNPPLSSEKPIIQVVVDSKEFYAECDKGYISVSEAEKAADLKISTTSGELMSVLASGNIKENIQNSVRAGKINLELDASYTTLFSKGYLTLYQDITGKSFTGSVVRIFAA